MSYLRKQSRGIRYTPEANTERNINFFHEKIIFPETEYLMNNFSLWKKKTSMPFHNHEK